MQSIAKLLAGAAGAAALVVSTFVGAVPAEAASGSLTMKSSSGGQSGSATATFSTKTKGQSVALEALSIVTTNTTETKTAQWYKVASAKQDANGRASFKINPLEVPHRYRARTGSGATQIITGEVSFAADRNTKGDGLATVYFDTYKGNSVNTRTRYFEGQFRMSGGSGCGSVDGAGAGNHARMKGRGNYSWSFPKKSFTLALDQGINLCGMGKSKKWALLGTQYDKSMLRTLAAFYIGSKLTNMAWTPKVTPVDLYVNGSYRGLYQLVERITIDDQRVNAGENNGKQDTGYLLEWDFRARDGGSSAPDHSITLGKRGLLGIKEPEDSDKVTSSQLSYIRKYVGDADKALFGSSYTSNSNGWQKYIDKNSAVDFYIAQEITKPVDGNMWASVYMYKKANGKLYFGPMWDYDLALGSANRAGGTSSKSGFYLRGSKKISAKQSTTAWFDRLNQDPEFRSAVRSRFNSVYGSLATTDNYLGGQRSRISKGVSANFDKYNIKEHLSGSQVVKGSYSAEVNYLTGWINGRLGWLKGNF